MKIRMLSVVIFVFFSSSLFASGKDIFDRFCTACHSPSMAPMFNSPPAHDVDEWQVRKNDAFDRAVENNASIKGSSGSDKDNYSIDELVQSAINGTDKGMPPKGTCNDCTDDDLKSVIEFMSSPE